MKQELDFIVIGAQKAGTTSLFEYMRRHPRLALPEGKEVPYFSHDATYGMDWGEYLRKAFPFADPSCRWGTVTTHYMVGGIYDAARSSPPSQSDVRTVPLRIRQRLPEVRLIAILRDPVERARSHHAMAILNGWDQRSFAQAIAELLTPGALEAARRVPDEVTGYVVWGEYGRILEGYLDVFEREQVLVLFTADLMADPATLMRRVFQFLEVDADYVPENLGTTYRRGGASRRLRWLDLDAAQRVAAGNSLARGLWHRLPEPARRLVDRRFNRINYLSELWNRRAADADGDTDDLESLAALREHYRADTARLTTLLGVRPPW